MTPGESVAVRLEFTLNMRSGILILALWVATALSAQTVHQPTPIPQPAGASVVFHFDWEQGRPWVKYTITVDDAGTTHFHGVGNAVESGDGDAYSLDFRMSDANRQKIFELAKQADYFRENLEAKAKNVAKTGQKTLEFHGKAGESGPPLDTSATYNYSANPNIQELTRIFQAVASTVDFGRKLAFDIRFDKLGLDARLQSLKEMQAAHFVEEVQAIEPILQKISTDSSVMHLSRVAAKQLLNSIGTTAPPPPATESHP